MKAFLDGFVSSGSGASHAFNGRIAKDLHIAQATEEMLQAFYRREHETVMMLAKQGAVFNTEMLQVAVTFRDHNLAGACIDYGVVPSEAMVRAAVDARDAPFADMLMRNMTASDTLKEYIARHGTEALRQTLDARAQYAL